MFPKQSANCLHDIWNSLHLRTYKDLEIHDMVISLLTVLRGQAHKCK